MKIFNIFPSENFIKSKNNKIEKFIKYNKRNYLEKLLTIKIKLLSILNQTF